MDTYKIPQMLWTLYVGSAIQVQELGYTAAQKLPASASVIMVW